MSSIYTPAGIVSSMQQRFQDWQADDYPGADKGIIEALDSLSLLRGVAPLWSCEGHLDVSSENKGEQGFYVMCAMTPIGFERISKVYVHMRDILANNGYPRINILRLSLSSRIIGHSLTMQPICILGVDSSPIDEDDQQLLMSCLASASFDIARTQ